MTDPCLFCKIVAGDIPSRTVYTDAHAVAFLDIAPFHRGHTLVVPRRHVADVLAEPPALAEIAPAIEHTSKLLVDRLGADGLNVFSSAGAVAGQDVFHLHVHLVPRYEAAAGLRGLFQRTASDDPAELDAVLAELGDG
ncbi:MAG: HIT domain-containing protein [Propionibacteriales bacterium]|nr:HIT domain-containing protein [Propionibacteriales bacterium]